MRCSSLWTSVAGISPAAILQNRQSATLPPQHEGSGNALQVVEHFLDPPPGSLGDSANLVFLPEPEFNNEPC